MLDSGIVQFLRNALTLFILKGRQTLGKFLGFLLQPLTLSDICDHANEPRRLTCTGELVSSIELQPALQAALYANPTNYAETTSRPHSILPRHLDCVRVVWMKVFLLKLLSGQSSRLQVFARRSRKFDRSSRQCDLL